MPAFVYNDGFPLFWGNPSPQKAGSIPGGAVGVLVEDLYLNQIPSGRADQIPLMQKVIPKQPEAQAPGTSPTQNVGSYGSTLYDAFMLPYDKVGGA